MKLLLDMKVATKLRHTCEGRYPVSVGFLESADLKYIPAFTLQVMQSMFKFDHVKLILPSQERQLFLS